MKLLSFFIIFTVLFTGCAKQEIQKPQNVEEIKTNKTIEREEKIHILSKSNSNTESFEVFLTQDDHISFICYQGNLKCNYFDKKKSAYKYFDEDKQEYVINTPDEDRIWVYKNGFSANFSKYTENIQCGRGSMGGWLVVLPFIDMKNHNKNNPELCYSRFTTLDSTQIGQRVVVGLLTFGTSLVTGGNMHTVKFDATEFKEVIVNSNLDNYKNTLFALSKKHRLKYGFDVIYLDSGDIEDSLSEAYEKIKHSNARRDGVIFIDEQSKKILSTILFKKYNKKSLIQNISNQLTQLFEDLDTSSKKINITQNDFTQYIPAKIKKPKLPPLPKLIKDEFEKRAAFEKRVEAAVKKREKQISELQKKYDLEVFKRNEYIKNLEISYQNYLLNLEKNHSALKSELNENLNMLSRIFFVQNLNGFQAKDFSYDAESENLYFTIYSLKKYFSQKVVANIPPKVAKRIKREKSYEIEPVLTNKKSALALNGFIINELKSDDTFATKYTNINYKPATIKVTVQTKKERIKNNHIAKEFKKFEQKREKIVDNRKEIWYIDMVKRINAKVPHWFTNPVQNDNVISYAQADTLEAAKKEALKELAYMIKVKVTSSFEMTKEANSSFKSFKDIKQDIVTTTDIELSKNDYAVLKQESMDGKWYVALVYKG